MRDRKIQADWNVYLQLRAFSGTYMIGNRQGKTEISLDLAEESSPGDFVDLVLGFIRQDDVKQLMFGLQAICS